VGALVLLTLVQFAGIGELQARLDKRDQRRLRKVRLANKVTFVQSLRNVMLQIPEPTDPQARMDQLEGWDKQLKDWAVSVMELLDAEHPGGTAIFLSEAGAARVVVPGRSNEFSGLISWLDHRVERLTGILERLPDD
jgi:hypothetical protein